jgi:hypothetical protein
MRSRKRNNLSPQIYFPRNQPANPTGITLLLPMDVSILQRQFRFADTTHTSDRRNSNSLPLLQLLV